MKRWHNGVWLSLAMGCVSGCAKSDQRVAAQFRDRVRPGPEIPTNIPEEDAPKVLPQTHLAAGKLFESQGQLGRAVVQYRKAIAVNHNNPEAHHRLGLLLSAVGRRDEALAALARAVELAPGDAVQRNNYGFELMLAGRWSEAETQLESALAAKPNFARARVNLGMVHGKLGRFDDALDEFRVVLPEADAYYNLGLVYRGQKRYPEAIGAFEQAIALNPGLNAANTQLTQLAAHRLGAPAPLTPDTPRSDQSDASALDGDRSLAVTGRTAPTNGSMPIAPAAPGSDVSGNEVSAIIDRVDGIEVVTSASAPAPSRPSGPPAWKDLAELNAMAEREFDCVRDEAAVLSIAPPTGPETPSDSGAEWWATMSPVSSSDRARAEPNSVSTNGEHDWLVREGTIDQPDFGFTLISGEGVRLDESPADEPAYDAVRDRSMMSMTVISGPVEGPTSPADWVEEPISSVDSWGLLRELEAELAIIRDEIECLNDHREPQGSTSELGSSSARPARSDEVLFESGPESVGPPAPSSLDVGAAPQATHPRRDVPGRRIQPARD